MVRWETPRICKRSARSTARSCAIWVSFPAGRPLRTAPIAWVVVAGVTACAICLLLCAKCPEEATAVPATRPAARRGDIRPDYRKLGDSGGVWRNHNRQATKTSFARIVKFGTRDSGTHNFAEVKLFSCPTGARLAIFE